MNHSIVELLDKIKVMHDKAVALNAATSSPIGTPNQAVVDYAIADIQALAREIANDIDRK